MRKLKNIIESPEYKKVEGDVENFVKEKLEHYIPIDVGKKTIHDPVWGLLTIQIGKCRLLTLLYFKD